MPDFINATNITPPRVPLIDQRTGLISREWYRFFLNLFTLTGSGTNQVSLVDLQLGPPPLQLESVNIDPSSPTVNPSDSPLTSQIAEIQKQINALQESPDCEDIQAGSIEGIGESEREPKQEGNHRARRAGVRSTACAPPPSPLPVMSLT